MSHTEIPLSDRTASSLARCIEQVLTRLHSRAEAVTDDEIGVAQREAAELQMRLKRPSQRLLQVACGMAGVLAFLGLVGFGIVCMFALMDHAVSDGTATLDVGYVHGVALLLSVALATLTTRVTGKHAEKLRLVRRLEAALRPLAQNPLDCEQALELVHEVDLAKQLRDAVVARGSELRCFHLEAMKRLAQAQEAADARERHTQACKALHGLEPATALRP